MSDDLDRFLKVRGAEKKFFVIGERINPTSKKRLSEEMISGDWTLVLEEVKAQKEAGADAIDLNVGVECDQPEAMREAVRAIRKKWPGPLVIDSPFPEVIRSGVEAAGTSVIVNSVTAQEKSLEALMPFLRDLQLPVIALALDGSGISQGSEKRMDCMRKILDGFEASKIPHERVWADPVVLPVRYYPEAVASTLQALSSFGELWGIKTCAAISNISFGLKKRRKVNAAFLSLARAYGLDAGILDPLDSEVMKRAHAESFSGMKENLWKEFWDSVHEANS